MHVLDFIRENLSELALWLGGLSLLVEVTPIKVNPWTYILESIGKRMNASIISRLDAVEVQLKAQDAKIDNNEKDRIKHEILDFVRAVRKNELPTKEEFDHILEQYDKYEVILAKLEQPNGKVIQAMKFINTVYLDAITEGKFTA